MSIVKLHRYGVSTYPLGEGTLALEAPGKPTLEVATPADFTDGIDGVWGPGELLIGALATCYELMVLAIAKRLTVPIHAVRTDSSGHIEHKNGVYSFVVIELDVQIETEPDHEHAADYVAELARERCIVASALNVPIRLNVEIEAKEREPAVV